jgi:hypothetical protein
MGVLGNAIANHLSKLSGMYSVELPETLATEMVDLVGTANAIHPTRALLVTDDPTAAGGVATTLWRDVLGWRTTDDRIFVWKRGNREPDTSFRSVVRPFITGRFPGVGGGECTPELLVQLCITELWHRRGRQPNGASFDAFYETALWVTGVLRYIFERAGSTPSIHWSDRFLVHWAGMLVELDTQLAAFGSQPDPRHAWELVRVSGLPLPSQIASGNPFLAPPASLEEKEWPRLAELWDDIVKSFILPEGGLAIFLTALDHQFAGVTKRSPWRDLPWNRAATFPAGEPTPVIGKKVFTATESPTFLTATFPQYPNAPAPSWWGVSTDDLVFARRKLQERTPLAPDNTCTGILRLFPGDLSPYVLNTRNGAVSHAHTAKKWRARISVGDIRLLFKEDWKNLHVSVLAPESAADGDAWINPDMVEILAKGAKLESQKTTLNPSQHLVVTLGLLVEYAANRDVQTGAIGGSWKTEHSLQVKLQVQHRMAGEWGAGRTIKTELELIVPSPYSPTVLVSKDGRLVEAAPDKEDEFEANMGSAALWVPDTTPTVLLKEEDQYDVHVYDGTLAPNAPHFAQLAHPSVGGSVFDPPSGAMFPPQSRDLDDGVLVSNALANSPPDIVVFKVKERSANLSSGLLSAVRGLTAGRKQPSAEARDSVLGQYQDRVTHALCSVGPTLPDSLYQYVISSSDAPVTWPPHPGTPSPMFLFDALAGFVLPGVGNGPSKQLTQSVEWRSFMQATSVLCGALGFVPGAKGTWLSGLDFNVIGAPIVRAYVEAHSALVQLAKKGVQAADAFWAAYPFSVMVVEGRPGSSFGQLLAVFLSPLHPARLAWSYAVTVIARCGTADPQLLQLVEGWNVPCTGVTVNPAGQHRQLVAVPIDPGSEHDFVMWSALAVLSDSGLADLPVFAAGQALPWGGRTGINKRVVERAIKDYLLVHPHLNSLEVDIRSVSPAPRSQEIDDAVLTLVAAADLEEVERLSGGARVWDSEDRRGTLPTRDRLFAVRGDAEQARPFEWRTYSIKAPPAEADIALVENASVHLAVVPGGAEGVVGLLPLRRFSPALLDQLRLDQNISPRAGEDLLGLSDLLREIENPDGISNVALRATPHVQALGIDSGARWEVLGTFNLDPALLSAVVASAAQAGEKRLLWEWRPSWIPVERKTTDLARRPYYVIARIPASLLKALQLRQGLTEQNATEMLQVLGHRGIGLAALNADAGTQESAAAGFFYAMQFFLPPKNLAGSAPSPGKHGAILGVIPVDPIESILEGLAGRKLDRRADLLAVAISLLEEGAVQLCFVPAEVKHHGMPSNPEPIPEPKHTELKRAREQLVQTAELLKVISDSIASVPSQDNVGGAYLRRLALATLIDLAMSFAPAQPAVSHRASILRGILSGSLSIGVGDPILLWFAPGSALTSGAPCVVDRYGPTIIDAIHIRELFIDPSTVPGLWWTSVPVGANEMQVRMQVNGVIEASFSACTSAGGHAASGVEEALRELLALPRETGGATGGMPAGGQAVPKPTTANSGQAEVAGPEAEGQPAPLVVLPASVGSAGQPVSGTVPSDLGLASSSDVGSAVPPPLLSEQPKAVLPRALIGWSSLTSRWTVVGKLAGTEDAVALDLDHPKTIGIFGYMGSGKSYLLGNLIESAVEPRPGINTLPVPLAVVVFNYRRNASDRFELSSLTVPNPNPADAERLEREYNAQPGAVRDAHVLCLPGELRPQRQQEYGSLGATELFFDPRSLGAEDWELLMGEPGSEAVFARTIRNTLVDLRASGDITLEALEHQVSTRLTGQSRNAARLRFDFVRRYISQDRGVDFGNLLRAGRVLIVDLRQPLFNKDDALRFFLVCANHISKVQGRFNKMIIFDEAHEYMSEAFGERMESRIRLMRHEGTSYVFATQDVNSIPMGISRFLTTRFVFDLGTRENMQDLEQAAPEFRGYQLLTTKPGYCFVQANTSLNGVFARPREIQVRPRVTQHGGSTQIFSTATQGRDE